MTADSRAMAAECDPVAAALSDPCVRNRLLTAARAYLGRSTNLTVAQCSAEAEEVVSIATVEAWKKRETYDPSRDVAAWLVGFIGNIVRNYNRKHRRQPTGPPPDAPALEDLAVDLGRPVAEAVADREYLDHLLAQLSPDDREIFLLKRTEDPTFAERAARLGSNENALRIRYFRIRQRLRQLAEQDGEVQS